jgi:hypothetical protein
VSGPGWGNPVVGGTTLRIPAIQSPNFSLANSTGWAIFANGSAYFFNVTVSGTITGGTLVVDGTSGGVFVYSGPPALGNLIGSWAGAAGTDGFGNVYPQGFNISKGAISGTVFSGADFIINTAGIFIYSGTPAAGNLLISLAGATGTDGFGNNYPQGLTVYGPSGAKITLEDNGTEAALLLLPAGVTSNTVAPQIITSAINTGGAAEIAELVITSGKESGNDDAAIVLVSESADATVAALAYFEFGGQICAFFARGQGIRAVQPGTTNVIEGWHAITLDTGWSTVANMPAPQYRMLASGEIEFTGAASHASFTTNQNLNGSNPLPATGYRPANEHVWRTGNGGTIADSAYMSTGVIQGLGQASGSVRIYLDGVCPLV